MPSRTIGTLALVGFQGAITSTYPVEYKLWRLHRPTTVRLFAIQSHGQLSTSILSHQRASQALRTLCYKLLFLTTGLDKFDGNKRVRHFTSEE
jgi:hypothetical protein